MPRVPAQPPRTDSLRYRTSSYLSRSFSKVTIFTCRNRLFTTLNLSEIEAPRKATVRFELRLSLAIFSVNTEPAMFMLFCLVSCCRGELRRYLYHVVTQEPPRNDEKVMITIVSVTSNCCTIRQMNSDHVSVPPKPGVVPSGDSFSSGAPIRTPDSVDSALRVHLCNDFVELDVADRARRQLEQAISPSTRETAATTRPGLTYQYRDDAYRFLTIPGEQVFEGDLLQEILDRLAEWGADRCGTTAVSSPRVRIYANGSWRGLVRDGVSARWHYLLFLGPSRDAKRGRRNRGQVTVLTDDGAGPDGRGRRGIGRTITLEPSFNQILTHGAEHAYGIDPPAKSTSPLDGLVILDGYLW